MGTRMMEQILKLRMTFKSQPETLRCVREVSIESSCQKGLHKESVGFKQPPLHINLHPLLAVVSLHCVCR